MEPHHHPPAISKKWTPYFREFLLLLLALFCDFLSIKPNKG